MRAWRPLTALAVVLAAVCTASLGPAPCLGATPSFDGGIVIDNRPPEYTEGGTWQDGKNQGNYYTYVRVLVGEPSDTTPNPGHPLAQGSPTGELTEAQVTERIWASSVSPAPPTTYVAPPPSPAWHCQLRSRSGETVREEAPPKNANRRGGDLWRNGDPAASRPADPKDATRASLGWHPLGGGWPSGCKVPGLTTPRVLSVSTRLHPYASATSGLHPGPPAESSRNLGFSGERPSLVNAQAGWQALGAETALTGGPPHRSVLEGLPHTAPTLGKTPNDERTPASPLDARPRHGVRSAGGWRRGGSPCPPRARRRAGTGACPYARASAAGRGGRSHWG